MLSDSLTDQLNKLSRSRRERLAPWMYEAKLKGKRGVLYEKVTDHRVVWFFLIGAFVHGGNIIGICFPKYFRDLLLAVGVYALAAVEDPRDLIIYPLKQRVLFPG